MQVITLVHGREQPLRQLIQGLEQSEQAVEALWIVYMNQSPLALHSERFPIRPLQVQGEAGQLPLARARNALWAAGAAGDWVFLDVDCIPAPSLLGAYAAALHAAPAAVHLGEVRYLPPGASAPGWTLASLAQQGVAHPLAQYRPAAGQGIAYELFWSLNFACAASTFARIGGFDEGYLGYGGEDTDFAFRARAADVPLLCAPALAFHQYHPSYEPPLNHLHAIVANARRFHRRWQRWPMEGWLGEFVDGGWLSWQDDELRIVREPTADEVQACLSQRGY